LAKKRKTTKSDPGWPMIFGVLGALMLFFFVALQTRSLCAFDGKIPQPPNSKAGQFQLQGPQIGRKASKALERGILSLGPEEFQNKPKDTAANRPPPPPSPPANEGSESESAAVTESTLNELPGNWCSIQDQEVGEKTLTTVGNFDRSEPSPGGFQDTGEIWVGILEAFDIARIRFERIATYPEKTECLEWTKADLEFTLAFQELLNHETENVRVQMRKFEKHFSKIWRLEWLNEDPCQPTEQVNADHVIITNPNTNLRTHSFRCEEEG
jgi:hypothetical protein